jgi:hypothetical protein
MENRFTTVDEILKNAIVQFGDGNNANYNKYLNYLIRGYNELGYDILKNVKRTYLSVDETTKTALIPKDYVNYVRVGFVNQVNEIVDLSYNNNIKLKTENPNKNCHCECGCDGEICYNTGTITANTKTTESKVLFPQTRYSNTYTTSLLFPLQRCTYTYEIPTITIPFMFDWIEINGQQVEINQPVITQSDLDDIFTNLGFTIDSGNYVYEQAFDIYGGYQITEYCINEVSPLSTTIKQECTYLYQYRAVTTPFTFNWIKINGVNFNINAPVVTQSDFTNVFINLGFTELVPPAPFFGYGKTSVDVYGDYEIEFANGTKQTISVRFIVDCVDKYTITYARPNSVTTPLVFDWIVIDGVQTNVNQTINNLSELDAIFAGYGFTVVGNNYVLNDSYFNYENYQVTEYCESENVIEIPITSIEDCVDAIGIRFPLTIDSISIFDSTTEFYQNPSDVQVVNRVFNNQEELDQFMTELGWTITGENIYTLTSPEYWVSFNGNVYNGDTDRSFTTLNAIDVVEEQVEYTNLTTICVNESGDITKQETVHGFGDNVERCTYYFTTDTTTFPKTDNTYTKDGIEYTMPDFDDFNEMSDYLYDLGIRQNNNYDPQTSEDMEFVIYDTASVYENIIIGGEEVPISTEDCYENREINSVTTNTLMCYVPKKECGCPELNDEVVNTLSRCGIISTQAWWRYLRGGDLYMKQALYDSAWGWFNINYNTGVIQLNDSFGLDTIYLEYYSANEIDSADYLVPLLSQDALISYIDMLRVRSKSNVPLYEKQRTEKRYSVEKKKLSQRLTPLRVQELLDILRTRQKP